MTKTELIVISGCFSKHALPAFQKINKEFFEAVLCGKVFEYAKDFYFKHNQIPSKDSLLAAFEKENTDLKFEIEILAAKLIDPLAIDPALFLQRIESLRVDFQFREIKTVTAEISSRKEANYKTVAEELKIALNRIELLSNDSILIEEFTSKVSGDALEHDYLKTKLAGNSQRFYMGVDSIDDIISGGAYGKLFVYAAITGHGKTSALIHHAYNMVFAQKKNVLFVEAEMSVDDIRGIFHAHHAYKKFNVLGMDTRKLFSGKLSEEEEKILLEKSKVDFYTNSEYGKLYFMNGAGLPIDAIFAYADSLQQAVGVDAIFIDYLSKLIPIQKCRDSREKIDSLYQYVEQKRLSFAKGRGVFVCTGHQINREGQKEMKVAKRQGELQTTDIKDTSEVENLADAVIGFYDPSKVNRIGNMSQHKTELIVTIMKHRRGLTPPPFRVEINRAVSVIKSLESASDQNGQASFDKPVEVLDLFKDD